MLANRVEPIHRHKWIRHRFWYKQRIAGPVESPGPFSEVLEIDIGRQEINAGRARAPHVDQMRQWTSARILTGWYPGRISAAFTNIGSGYSALPSAVTRSTYRAKCQAMKISSVPAPLPKISSHVPRVLNSFADHTVRNSGRSCSLCCCK